MDCDTLVIGNGIAGSLTALLLAEQGQRVVILAKGETLEETNTSQAQGGIVFRGKDDSPRLLCEDILKASSYSTWKKSAHLVSRLGPLLVDRLLCAMLRVPFDRDSEGNLDFFQEGAHSRRRILHVKDYTGRVIQQILNQRISTHPLIEIKREFFGLELIISSFHAQEMRWRYRPRECFGVYALNTKKREVIPIIARNTVLASGGLNAIYEYSSGGPWATGDGLVMAQRAGAHLVNMEYVQFHPTLLYSTHALRFFLISEAVRGEGAELIDQQGKPFMQKYHPLGSLAPRDIVARAIFQELQDTQAKCVYLDLYRHLSPEKILTSFPGIYETLLQSYHLDITKEPIPVVPGAHFLCGGILTDTWGRTNLRRLYAVGEVACTGLHGANRLASTSLLEGVTFAYRVSRDILRTCPDFFHFAVRPWEEKIGDFPASVIEELKCKVKINMWKHVGLIRRREGLLYALETLLQLKKESFALRYRYGASREIVELQNMIESALLVTESALQNPRSCGVHFRSDSPKV